MPLASMLALVLSAAPPVGDTWVVVAAPAYLDAVAPLAKHRRAEGHRVVIVNAAEHIPLADLRQGKAPGLVAHLDKIRRDSLGATRVLVVGKVLPSGLMPERTCVPALGGTQGRMRLHMTDSPYASPDAAGLPRAVVGRLPAQNADEVAAYVKRVLDYEADEVPGVWRDRLTVLAGVPAFNAVVDRLVEKLAFDRFDRIAPRWTGGAIYTNARSRFSLPPKDLRARAKSLLEGGQAFAVYLGHSDAGGLHAGVDGDFLSRADFAKMDTSRSVLVSYGCHACQLAGLDGEGYGVAAVRNPKGPVGVLGSHDVCFAAMVQLASDGLFASAFSGSLPARLGDLHLASLGGIAAGKIDFFTYRLLDQVDGDPKIPQAVQRREHLEMFQLLGDPALRLPRARSDVAVSLPERVAPGEKVTVTVTLPERLRGARVRVTLERTPGSEPAGVAMKEPLTAEQVRARFAAANDFVLVSAETTAAGTTATLTLAVPVSVPYANIVARARAVSGNGEATRAARVAVERPEKKE